jgi:hypothetical protein
MDESMIDLILSLLSGKNSEQLVSRCMLNLPSLKLKCIHHTFSAIHRFQYFKLGFKIFHVYFLPKVCFGWNKRVLTVSVNLPRFQLQLH